MKFASVWGGSFVSTEHLLLGLLDEPDTGAAFFWYVILTLNLFPFFSDNKQERGPMWPLGS